MIGVISFSLFDQDSYEAYGESEDDLLDDERDQRDSDDEIFDLSYWHITIPHLDYILEKNKRVCGFNIIFTNSHYL